MRNDFEFDLGKSIDTQAAVEAEGMDAVAAPVKAGSEAEQIAALREEAVERSKRLNESEWGFGYPQSHYESFAGDQTSAWDFGTLKTICGVIELPGPFWMTKGDKTFFGMWKQGSYSSQTGVWFAEDKSATVPICELRAKVADRIAVLELDPVALYCWAVGAHDEAESKLVRHMSLEKKCERFRQSSSSQPNGSMYQPLDL